MTAAQASALLSAPPYSYFVTTQPGNGSGAVGTVYQTSPAVGTTLAQGSPITIFVTSGLDPYGHADGHPDGHPDGDADALAERGMSADQLRLRGQGALGSALPVPPRTGRR